MRDVKLKICVLFVRQTDAGLKYMENVPNHKNG